MRGWKWPVRILVVLIVLFCWAYWVAIGIPAMAIYTLIMGGLHVGLIWMITGI